MWHTLVNYRNFFPDCHIFASHYVVWLTKAHHGCGRIWTTKSTAAVEAIKTAVTRISSSMVLRRQRSSYNRMWLQRSWSWSYIVARRAACLVCVKSSHPNGTEACANRKWTSCYSLCMPKVSIITFWVGKWWPSTQIIRHSKLFSQNC